MNCITQHYLHYIMLHHAKYNYSCCDNYDNFRYTTLDYTTLLYITLHYTHCITTCNCNYTAVITLLHNYKHQYITATTTAAQRHTTSMCAR